MSLVDISFVAELLEVESDELSHHYIDLAEANAKGLIGYLAEELKDKSFYIFTSSKIVNLDECNAVIEKVKYRVSASSDYTEVAEDSFRYLPDKGLILLDAALPEDAECVISFKIGWTRNTLPKIVKLLIVLLTIEVLNKFKPGTVVQSEIKSKKIGDYTITYATDNKVDAQVYSIRDIDRLVILIKQGTNESTSQI
jgi:hypothetical protein